MSCMTALWLGAAVRAVADPERLGRVVDSRDAEWLVFWTGAQIATWHGRAELSIDHHDPNTVTMFYRRPRLGASVSMKPGDIVALAGGGPLMTVVQGWAPTTCPLCNSEAPRVEVAWIGDDGVSHGCFFPPEALRARS